VVRLSFRFNGIAAAAAGTLIAIGTALPTFLPNNPTALLVGALLFIFGLPPTVLTFICFTRPVATLLERWDWSLVFKALRAADPNSTVRILQTSIPDATALFAHLETLLIKEGKQFKLHILLVDYENAKGLIEARMRLRNEELEDHLQEIKANIKQLIGIKKRVDSAWADSRNGAQLDLEIRLYDFLPFGSHFQIGKDVIFIGLFWNKISSVGGPMIRVTGSGSRIWNAFEEQFVEGWKSARASYSKTVSSSLRIP
jgi:hypothetical protein